VTLMGQRRVEDGQAHPRPGPGTEHRPVSRQTLMLLSAGLMVLAAGGLVALIASGLLGQAGAGLRSALDRSIQPAMLAPLHAAEADAQDCRACHDLLGHVPDDKCLTCHQEVARGREQGEGLHPSFTSRCGECHADHHQVLIDLASADLDPTTLDHDTTRYPLRGAHAELDCAACHERPARNVTGLTRLRYLELSYALCVDCHQDPHQGQLAREGETCRDCHTVAGWDGEHVSLDHAAVFALEGAHADAGCADCHAETLEGQPAPTLAEAHLRGLPQACADCHQDPHQGQYAPGTCADCHGAWAWGGEQLAFTHADVWPLEGAHADAGCADCHQSTISGAPAPSLAAAQLRDLPQACADCHGDVHQGQFAPGSCAGCHDSQAWTGEHLAFTHDDIWALEGAHADAGCADCHAATVGGEPAPSLAAAQLRDLPQACADCHDDVHRGQFPVDSCTGCHDSQAWTGEHLAFVHADVWPLEGAHADAGCVDCHATTISGTPAPSLAAARLRDLPQTCADCHGDPHGTYARVGDAPDLTPRACTECHDERAWTGEHLTFDHDRDASFALDATHRSVACADCHDGLRFRPTPAGCAECHQTTDSAMRGEGLPAASPHAGLVSCQDCHHPQDVRPSLDVFASRCAECHTPFHGRLVHSRATRGAELLRETGYEGPFAEQLHHNYPGVERYLESVLRKAAGSDQAR
jgi:Class III cytochrome C family